MEIEIVVHPIEYTWRPLFKQTSGWNERLLALAHEIWQRYEIPNTLLQPLNNEGLPRQVDIYDVRDGERKIVFSSVLFTNSLGEWTNFSANGFRVPFLCLTFLENVSDSMNTLLEVYASAKRVGFVLDITSLVFSGSVPWSCPIGKTSTRDGLHRGNSIYSIGNVGLEAYLGNKSQKFRRNARNVLAKAERLGYTYTREDTLIGSEWLATLLMQWFDYKGSIPELSSYDMRVYSEYMVSTPEHIMCFAIRKQGELVGCDILLFVDNCVWYSVSTPYDTAYRKDEVGNFAMLSAIIAMEDGRINASELLLGTPKYDEDSYAGAYDPSQEYKIRWSTHANHSCSVGMGMWENRDPKPTILIGSLAHRFSCLIYHLYTLGLISQDIIDANVSDPYQNILQFMLRNEQEYLPEGWNSEEHVLSAWNDALLGESMPKESNEYRIFTLGCILTRKTSLSVFMLNPGANNADSNP